MAEYIERKVLDKAMTVAAANDKDKNRRTWAKAICILHDLPASDVAPVVHGRWVAQCIVETDGGWALEDAPYNEYQHSNPICSICRKTALLDGGEDYVASPYCPKCGARMDGDSDAKAD